MSKKLSSKLSLLILPLVILIFAVLIWRSPSPDLPQQNSSVTINPKEATSSSSISSLANPPTQPSITSKISINSTDNNQVSGSIVITNLSDLPDSNLSYSLKLYKPDTLTFSGKTPGFELDYQISQSFSIDAKQTESFDFTLPYSPHIPSGQYQILSFLYNSQSQPLYGAQSTNINLKGTNDLLSFNKNCSVVVGNQEFNSNIAPLINPNQQAIGKCNMTNPTSKSLNLRYKIIYSPFNVGGVTYYPITTQISTETVAFGPHETKDVLFKLPQLSTPQVYGSQVSLIDDQNQNISSPTTLRWTVKGPSARIDKISLDKDYYSSGNKASVTVQATPSLDLFWSNPGNSNYNFQGTNLDNAKLSVSITSNNKVCGQSQINLPKTSQIDPHKLIGEIWPDQNLSIPINQDCPDPKVSAKITQGNVELASLGSQVFSSQQSKDLANQNRFEILKKIGLVLLAILIAAIIFIFSKKNRGGKKLLASLLVILGLLTVNFFTPQARAGISFKVPGDAMTTWGPNGDAHKEYLWQPGSKVTVNNDNTMTITMYWHIDQLGCNNETLGTNFTVSDSSNNTLTPLGMVASGNGITEISGSITTGNATGGGVGTAQVDNDSSVGVPIPNVFDNQYSLSGGNNGDPADGVINVTLGYIPPQITVDGEGYMTSDWSGSDPPSHFYKGSNLRVYHSSNTTTASANYCPCLPAFDSTSSSDNATFDNWCRVANIQQNTDNNKFDGIHYIFPTYQSVDISDDVCPAGAPHTKAVCDRSVDTCNIPYPNGGWPNGYSDSGVENAVTRIKPCYCQPASASSVCTSDHYRDSCGNLQDSSGNYLCGTGSIQPECVGGQSVCGGSCDTADPSISWVNISTASCYTSSTWASAQPLAVVVSDPSPSSGLKNVVFQLLDSSNNLVSSQTVSSPSNPQTVNVSFAQPANGTYSLKATVTDNANNSQSINTPNFDVKTSCSAPFIYGSQGDVHSNTSINTQQ